MRSIKLVLASLLLASACVAQSPTTLNVSNPQLAGMQNVTQVGATGSTTYCYWVVVEYTAGNSAPAGPVCTTQANSTLSATNYNVVNFYAPTSPVSAVSSYDILRTTSTNTPSGACACAVATAQSGTPVNDQSNSLSAYTVSTLGSVVTQVLGDNETLSGRTMYKSYINGTLSLNVSNAASTTNTLEIQNGANGTAPAIQARGASDSTVSINFVPKSTGTVQVGGNTIATSTGVIQPVAGAAQTITTVPFTAFLPYPLLNGLTGLTSTTDVNGTIWWSQIFIPTNSTLTGACVLLGAGTPTDNVELALYNQAGAAVAHTASTTLTGTASTLQCIAFTVAYSAVGPAAYEIALQGNGTTAGQFYCYKAGYAPTNFGTGNQTGVFGNLATITPTQTFTTNIGPVVVVY